VGTGQGWHGKKRVSAGSSLRTLEVPCVCSEPTRVAHKPRIRSLIAPPLQVPVSSQLLHEYGRTFEVPWFGAVPVHFTLLELAALLTACPVAALYFKTKHWLLNNLLGMAFAVQGMEAVSLGSVKVAHPPTPPAPPRHPQQPPPPPGRVGRAPCLDPRLPGSLVATRLGSCGMLRWARSSWRGSFSTTSSGSSAPTSCSPATASWWVERERELRGFLWCG